MKDIDFDELDKAVSSLMSDSDVVADKKDDTVVTVKPTLGPDEKPSFDELEKTASKAAEIAGAHDTTGSLATKRSSGRFMDVFHPSADMKRPTPDGAAAPVSRQGLTITPPEPATPPVEAMEEPEQEKLATADMPADPPKTAHNEWPDPIDFAAKKNGTDEPTSHATPLEDPTITTDAAVIDEVIADKKTAVAAAPDAPLASPFLPDAKVAKRPLGELSVSSPEEDAGAASEGTQEAALTGDEAILATITAEPETQTPADTVSDKVLLPEELDSDLISVEADSTEPMSPHGATTQEIAPRDEAEKEASDARMNVPASIQQQYKEAPSSAAAPGAIYDVDNYHQPLAHPEQKKSGWMMIVWIVLLLIVGAGGGAAVYYFLLQN